MHPSNGIGFQFMKTWYKICVAFGMLFNLVARL